MPALEVEVGRIWDVDVGEHQFEDVHHFRLYVTVWQRLNALGELALKEVRWHAEYGAFRYELTVTVTTRIPEPGRNDGWSRLCQTGYRPRS